MGDAAAKASGLRARVRGAQVRIADQAQDARAVGTVHAALLGFVASSPHNPPSHMCTGLERIRTHMLPMTRPPHTFRTSKRV